MFTTALTSWRWRVVGDAPYDDTFVLPIRRIGEHIGIGIAVSRAGFIDRSSKLRLASPKEMAEMENTNFCPPELVEDILSRLSSEMAGESERVWDAD